jgi:glycosyltransferase involved in cell wall biosynthesis
MKFLFVHQNFPGQYLHLAKYLADQGHDVRFITQRRRFSIPKVRCIVYKPSQRQTTAHSFVSQFDAAVGNGMAVAATCRRLHESGFLPDLVVGHAGWGEILFIKDVWPRVPVLGYFEFYYQFHGTDVTFDPEFAPSAADPMRIRLLNAVNLLTLQAVDWGHSPTQWQRSLYPQEFQSRISVVHEGVDTETIRPNQAAMLFLKSGRVLSAKDEVVTYSARNLEPYRGFHIFMRALPELLSRRPKAQVVIVGDDGVSYSRRPRRGTYRQQLLRELRDQLDFSRIHFVGRLPFEQYVNVLQVSSAHVYLTYPFVLSWSALEAMAAGCVMVCSRTPPVQEVIKDGVNGQLVDFFDISTLVGAVEDVLRNPAAYAPMRHAARASAVRDFDLRTVSLPAQMDLMERVARRELVRVRENSNS